MKAAKRFFLVWMIVFLAAIVKWSDEEWLNNPTVLIIGFVVTALVWGLLDIFGKDE